MRTLVLLAAAASCVVGHPQYGTPADEHQVQEGSSVGADGEYWWQKQEVFKNTGNHPPTQPQCGQGSDCVPFYQCNNGVIDTSGSGQLDLRKGPAYPTQTNDDYITCGDTGNDVCCRIPHDHATAPIQGPPYPHCSAGLQCVLESACNLYTGFMGVNIPLYEGQPFLEYNHCTSDYIDVGVCCQEHPVPHPEPIPPQPPVPYPPINPKYVSVCLNNEDCVQPIYCHQGVIITDGSGLLDLRKNPDYPTCVDPSYLEDVGVCCRLPEAPSPVSNCPDYSICTDRMYCSDKGFIVPDPFESPAYGDGLDCFTNPGISYNVGVCCSPIPEPIAECPATSLCIPEYLCFGDIMDGGGAFSPYVAGGSFSQCTLPGSDAGICCDNPEPDVIVPQQCGVSHYGTKDDSLKTRIHVPSLDKLEADFGELPWQAIVFFSNYTFKCGASLISDRHLLTVAHCVNGLHPSDLRIRVGEWQVNTFTEPLPYQDLDVTSITVHPHYKPGPHWNNIAIIELKYPVEVRYNINSVCLPFGGISFQPGTYCLVSGWGKDSFTGTYQHILKKIEVPLVDHHTCQDLLRYTRLGKYFRLHDSYMCAGGEEGKDACVGDGGGPLICYDQGSKSYVQVGMTAWGIGCGVKDVPGAYTDISKFTSWIGEVTGLGGSGPVGGYRK